MPISPFVDNKYRPCRSIPSSCIEATEYLIQAIRNNNPSMAWSDGCVNKPHVIAEFGGGVTFNITTDVNFQKSSLCGSLTGYKFSTGEPKLGEGLILLRKGSYDAGKGAFNMHLGAVVARETGRIFISDISQNSKKVSMTINWEVWELTSVAQFRGDDYPASDYALGILRPEY